ncbi:hypothetical protein PFISCL1PPCAC_20280 [Pristionchus fissidentatus]|uniref:MATH domain-containing protein n=1 Tax=Pristionchus fissidentatus TaxID=1538716 RepID=A0AAV5WBR6_9BILA|nr:hypothetical protein PFISCL1PPCAC_20280 [Pristionchus fissidentatus]
METFDKMPQLSLNSSSLGATEGTIRARFTNISELTEKSIRSQPMNIAGMDWSVMIRAEMDSKIKYLGVYLARADNLPFPSWSCTTSLKINLINPSTMFVAHSRELVGIVFTSANFPGWGYKKFILFDDLKKSTHSKGDAILISIDVKAFPCNSISK